MDRPVRAMYGSVGLMQGPTGTRVGGRYGSGLEALTLALMAIPPTHSGQAPSRIRWSLGYFLFNWIVLTLGSKATVLPRDSLIAFGLDGFELFGERGEHGAPSASGVWSL